MFEMVEERESIPGETGSRGAESMRRSICRPLLMRMQGVFRCSCSHLTARRGMGMVRQTRRDSVETAGNDAQVTKHRKRHASLTGFNMRSERRARAGGGKFSMAGLPYMMASEVSWGF